MLQNTSKTLGFQKIMVYKTPPGGGGKPYLARGLYVVSSPMLLLWPDFDITSYKFFCVKLC